MTDHMSKRFILALFFFVAATLSLVISIAFFYANHPNQGVALLIAVPVLVIASYLVDE